MDQEANLNILSDSPVLWTTSSLHLE